MSDICACISIILVAYLGCFVNIKDKRVNLRFYQSLQNHKNLSKSACSFVLSNFLHKVLSFFEPVHLRSAQNIYRLLTLLTLVLIT